MFGNMIDKLQQMKQQVEEIKEELSHQRITESSEGMKVTVDGNRKIIDISVPEEMAGSRETIEDLLVITLNKALDRSEAVHEQAMAKNASGLLGNIPGMG